MIDMTGELDRAKADDLDEDHEYAVEPMQPPRSCPWPAPVPTYTYIAGAAGSGKTFLTKAWAEEEPGLTLCATTGIAAINLGGTTINGLLGYFDTKSLQDAFTIGFLSARLGKLWRAGVRRLIIDEVSMLDADQLTYLVRGIEEVNGRGYVLDAKWDDEATPPNLGLTLVGDFAQLPPVKAPFAFESPEWPRFLDATHTLTEIRRQADPAFIEALRAARRGDGRAALDYFGPTLHNETDDHFAGPTIFAKNDSVDRFNQLRMDKLPGSLITFQSARWGEQRSEWGNPKKPPTTWGIPAALRLKEGSLVMILANKRDETRRLVYVNGDLGTLIGADDHQAIVKMQRTGKEVGVDYVHREKLQPCDSARRTELRNLGQAERIAEGGKWEILGAIDYMPLRLAYATTVHKAQGLSLEQVQVNIRDAFFKTPSMLYVALSRARTSAGLRLVGSAAAFVERCTMDPRIAGWL